MKAVVLRDINDLAVLDVPVPAIGPEQALVRMTHCGICGSDIRYLRGDNPWAKQTLGETLKSPRNIILGHEAVGVVERVGSEADWALVGRRVALLAFGTCGECIFCRRGEEHLCPDTQHLGHGAGWGTSDYYYGGMAEYIPVYTKWLFPLADNVTFEAASTLDPLGVAVHAVRKAHVQQGDTVLIVGGGAVGALAVQVARLSGAARIVLVDVSDAPLSLARSMGADLALNAVADDVAAGIIRMSDGLGARAVIDTIGVPLDSCLPLLARGGTYVTLTVTEQPQHFATIALAGERSITSSCNFQYPDYHEAMTLLEEEKVDAAAIITHSFPLTDALEAFRVAEDKAGAGAVKVVLTGTDGN